MTYLQAIIHFIRRHSRKGDGLVETFKVVCENRRSAPVRQWAIYDLANKYGLSQASAARLYDRHLKRLEELFVSVR